MRKQKIKLLFKDSYLAMIKNSVGSNMFFNRYSLINGKKIDIIKSGKYRIACAFFVSTILLFSKLIQEPHLTVDGVEWDLKKSGWFKIKKPKIGCIVIWEKTKVGDKETRHAGFFIGSNKAISTHHQTGKPYIHNLKYRKIESIWWHKNLDS